MISTFTQRANPKAADPSAFRRAVLRWYHRHGRDLPWRRTRDPYAILVSEIMLQQTQVSRVIPKYRAFLHRFPTVRALAAAQLGDVLRSWSGLGYNLRARRLWECAREINATCAGHVPRDPERLRALPGIGRYTAGALASFAFGAREPAVDTNVRRVLSRALLGAAESSETRIWALAQAALPRDAAKWNHALMDVGALFCRATPACDACPARNACVWFSRGSGGRPELRSGTTTKPELRSGTTSSSTRPFHGSRREHRGRVVRALTRRASMSLMQLGPQVKVGFGKTDLPWLAHLLGDLERDGLVALNAQRTRARLP